MKNSIHSTNGNPAHDEIAALAQQIYEDDGCPCGKAEEHWLEAERRLHQQPTGKEPHPAVLVAGHDEPQRASIRA